MADLRCGLMNTPEDAAGGPRSEPFPPPAWDPPGQRPAGSHGQPGYGPTPGWGPAPAYPGPGSAGQYSGKAVAALVLAITSFVALPLIAAVVSLVLASQAKREIALSGGRLGGEGMVTAARIASWVNIALSVAVGALIAAVIGYALTTSGTTS